MEATVTLNELWAKREHPTFRECMDAGHPEIAEDMPQWQWTKWNLSIIAPCRVTFERYELFDWVDVERFHTLEEAQAAWDKLLSNKK